MGELRRSSGGNIEKMRLEISLYTLASIALLLGFLWLLFDEVELDVAPGLMAVLYVVAIGISLTASVYHIVRLRVVGQLRDHEDSVVALHVKVSRTMRDGGLG